MRRSEREAAYTAFVLARQDHLRRVAYALCGDWHDADDLLQTALTELYVAWSRVAKDGSPEAYVRRILVHTNIDAYRLRQRRVQTISLESGAEVPGRERLGSEEHAALIEAIQSLPEMQRKVVVLRHWLGQEPQLVKVTVSVLPRGRCCFLLRRTRHKPTGYRLSARIA